MEATSRIFVLIFLTVFWLIFLATYIIKSIGVYKIAKAGGTSYPVLAWIPIISTCYLGFIADGINIKNGRRACNKSFLVVATIVSAILFILTVVFSITSEIMSSYADTQGLSFIFTLFAVLFQFLLSISVLFVTVFTYVSAYAIYEKYEPSNKILYVTLTIVLNLGWLFLFLIGISKSKNTHYDISSPNL